MSGDTPPHASSSQGVSGDRRILVACFETPGYGGASTATYALFERMQRDGLDVTYLNLVDAASEKFLRDTFGANYDNPRRLRNVRTHTLAGAFHQPQPKLAHLLGEIAPDVVVAVGFIAALAVKQAAPTTHTIFFTAGCDQVDRYLRLFGDATGVCDAMRTGAEPPLLFHEWERRAVELADLILVHSPLVRDLCSGFYPYQAGKLYPDVISMAEWIRAEPLQHASLALPFDARDIDLLFVASRWDRYEKNFPFVRGVIEACRELRVHIVGLAAPPVGNSVRHGLITSRAELFALMGRSKAVVCPSLFDAAPGVLFEAEVMGCNVVASKNCGNWALCAPELLVEPATLAEFVRAARVSVTRPYVHATPIDFGCGYATLLDACILVQGSATGCDQ